jgi:hypothetical protein
MYCEICRKNYPKINIPRCRVCKHYVAGCCTDPKSPKNFNDVIAWMEVTCKICAEPLIVEDVVD